MNALATFSVSEHDGPPPSLRAERAGQEDAHLSGVIVRRLIGLDTVVISKTRPGFSRAAVEACAAVVRECARSSQVKFLVFDFAQTNEAGDGAGDGFGDLVSQVANLILLTPVVSIAIARGPMRAADLELALACNIMISEEGASFRFDVDPLASVRTYAFLAQKIGFVRAERLMENGQLLDPAGMQVLMLLKDILEPGATAKRLSEVMRKYLRRHNFFYGMHRAQRIAAPYIHQFDPPARFS